MVAQNQHLLNWIWSSETGNKFEQTSVRASGESLGQKLLPGQQRELVGDWESNKRTVERMGCPWRGNRKRRVHTDKPERNGNPSLPRSGGQRWYLVAGEGTAEILCRVKNKICSLRFNSFNQFKRHIESCNIFSLMFLFFRKRNSSLPRWPELLKKKKENVIYH